jgi:hypothetical protein
MTKTAKMGRPTKYIPSLVKKIDEYITEAVPENMKIPTIEGLALKLGVNRDTLYDWAKKYPDFSDTIKALKLKQKEHLTEIGIFGGKEINASIVSLLLKVNHDMKEKDININVKVLPILGGKSNVSINDGNQKIVEAEEAS